MDTALQPAMVEADLGFSRPAEVVEDEGNRGLRRAVTRPVDQDFSRQFEYRRCQIRDLCGAGHPQPGLRSMGFETIDLRDREGLQSLLCDVRVAGEISVPQSRQLRRYLQGSVFPLSQGRCLKMLHVAPEGLVMRKGGPNGLKVDPHRSMTEMNHHDVALAIHGDQDVRGTPLRQIMRGFAPSMFNHRTPDGSNHWSPLTLVNLWIPLQQITRPLALMDRRTLNARKHQLRYALPTDTFLDRREDMRLNDIWAFLHDDDQRWYFHSHMNHQQAYVFDTLGEPHGSFTLPGEDVAEHYYQLLHTLSERLAKGVFLQSATTTPPSPSEQTTAPLRKAIDSMASLVAHAPNDKSEQSAVDVWQTRAAEAMDSVIRKSLEMRVVAVVLPNLWPFNRRS